MTSERRVLVYETRDALTRAVADRFIRTMRGVLDGKQEAHVVLTGGTVGIAVLAAIAAARERETLDWSRLHFWWGDERWLPTGDAERNDRQADDALLRQLGLAADHVHRFPAADGELDLDAAAGDYARELREHAEPGEPLPRFDVVFLGIGPDAHIASLFPGREGIRVTEATAIAVRNSPKPPPERLSLTLPAINSADRVWVAGAGADKASALGLALAGANTIEVPGAGARGRHRTVFFLDADAAAEVPEDLIASEY